MCAMSNLNRVIRFKFPFAGIINNQRLQALRVAAPPLMRLKSSATKTDSEEEDNKPLRYSTSRAGNWTARQSRVGKKPDEEIPWFQPYAITASLTVFLIYFCVLREENDVDEELGRTLYSRIDGLEKKQLEISLEYNLDQGLDATAIKNRLEEIDQEKLEN